MIHLKEPFMYKVDYDMPISVNNPRHESYAKDVRRGTRTPL